MKFLVVACCDPVFNTVMLMLMLHCTLLLAGLWMHLLHTLVPGEDAGGPRPGPGSDGGTSSRSPWSDVVGC